MIPILVILVSLLVTLVGVQLARRRPPTGSPTLADLRRTLEAMECDYRLRVATEELTRQTPTLREIGRRES
jgi:hypothetical protein